MQRRFLPVLWAFTLLLFTMQATAHAASYVVAPFQVNGPDNFTYLQKAVPPMLSSRLFTQGKFEPVAGQDAATQGAPVKARDAADKLRQAQKADYVIWGSVTVMGQEASLDVSTLDKNGKVWHRSAKSPVNGLIDALQTTAVAINREVFGNTAAAASSRPAPSRTVAPLNSDIVMNERQAGTTYLNPQIRYQGVETDRIRSQMLNIESRGMAVADVDGDKQNEVLLIDDAKLYVYRWENNRLTQLADFKVPTMLSPLLVRTVNVDGRQLIVLTCYDATNKGPNSYILALSNNKLSVVGSRILYYLNVVDLPPQNTPTLIGQEGDTGRVARGEIFTMVRQGDNFVRGSTVSNLPREANVFNFARVPGNERSGGDYTVVINDMDNMITFDGAGKRLAKSDDAFSGTSVRIPTDQTMPGMGSPSDTAGTIKSYFVPMRMIVADVDKDGRSEVLINKPVSTAGMLFQNFRTYPQGEIHALQWDGVGMDLLWKTRRIKGTVVDICLADVNNDGVMDLVVNVNSYPGALGVDKVRSLVTLYPLDGGTTGTKPNVPVDFDE